MFILKGKEKAVVGLVITLITTVLGVIVHFSGLPPELIPDIELIIALVGSVGTTLGVFNTTNTVLPDGEHEAIDGDTSPTVEPSTNL